MQFLPANGPKRLRSTHVRLLEKRKPSCDQGVSERAQIRTGDPHLVKVGVAGSTAVVCSKYA